MSFWCSLATLGGENHVTKRQEGHRQWCTEMFRRWSGGLFVSFHLLLFSTKKGKYLCVYWVLTTLIKSPGKENPHRLATIFARLNLSWSNWTSPQQATCSHAGKTNVPQLPLGANEWHQVVNSHPGRIVDMATQPADKNNASATHAQAHAWEWNNSMLMLDADMMISKRTIAFFAFQSTTPSAFDHEEDFSSDACYSWSRALWQTSSTV